jgi:putative DNA primase/helicase
MTPLETVLAHLPSAKKTKGGWSARCPVHDDRKASLSISQGDDGTALLKCHAGCDTEAVLSAIGLKMADLFPKHGTTPNRNGKPKAKGKTFATAQDAVAELERQHGKVSSVWTYYDAQGEPVGMVLRWDKADGKDIRPVARTKDGWCISAIPAPRPLYCLPELAKANLVLVCEGEKATDGARSLGFTATTSAGGSQAASKTDWRPLAGKEVWILPDRDTPGRGYSDTVAGILAKLTPAAKVRIVELPGLPESGDIADWIGPMVMQPNPVECGRRWWPLPKPSNHGDRQHRIPSRRQRALLGRKSPSARTNTASMRRRPLP